MKISLCSGKPGETAMLVTVPGLVIIDDCAEKSDGSIHQRWAVFGASGFRGSVFVNAKLHRRLCAWKRKMGYSMLFESQ